MKKYAASYAFWNKAMKLSRRMSAFDILVTIKAPRARYLHYLHLGTKLIVELKRYNDVSTALRFLTRMRLLFARVLCCVKSARNRTLLTDQYTRLNARLGDY